MYQKSKGNKIKGKIFELGIGKDKENLSSHFSNNVTTHSPFSKEKESVF